MDEFNTHPALIATAIEFSKATEGLVDFVAKRLAPSVVDRSTYPQKPVPPKRDGRGALDRRIR